MTVWVISFHLIYCTSSSWVPLIFSSKLYWSWTIANPTHQQLILMPLLIQKELGEFCVETLLAQHMPCGRMNTQIHKRRCVRVLWLKSLRAYTQSTVHRGCCLLRNLLVSFVRFYFSNILSKQTKRFTANMVYVCSIFERKSVWWLYYPDSKAGNAKFTECNFQSKRSTLWLQQNTEGIIKGVVTYSQSFMMHSS